MGFDLTIAHLISVLRSRPIGYSPRPGAERITRWPSDSVRIATHAFRPALRIARDQTVQEEGGTAFAATTEEAVSRLEESEQLAASGFTMTGHHDLVPFLVEALELTPDDRFSNRWQSGGCVLELAGHASHLYCNDPRLVMRCLDISSAHALRVRLVGRSPIVEETITFDEIGLTESHSSTADSLTIGHLDAGFVQVRGEGQPLDVRIHDPGTTRWVVPPHIPTLSNRARRWVAEMRLAFDRSRSSEPPPPLGESPWRQGCQRAAELSPLVGLDPWGAIDDARYGLFGAENARLLESPDGPLVAVGHFPIGGKTFVDERGWIYSRRYPEAQWPSPVATTVAKLIEKQSLTLLYPRHVTGGIAWARINGRAGKNFWKRLAGNRNEEASDDVSEHVIGDELWVERGLEVGGQEEVVIRSTPQASFVDICRRLSRTSSGATLRVRADTAAGRERYQVLKEAGLNVST